MYFDYKLFPPFLTLRIGAQNIALKNRGNKFNWQKSGPKYDDWPTHAIYFNGYVCSYNLMSNLK